MFGVESTSSDYLVVIPQSGSQRSTFGNAWRLTDAAYRQRRLSLRTVQTLRGIEGDFRNHVGEEKLVGFEVRVVWRRRAKR
jgi:hypothetical protein